MSDLTLDPNYSNYEDYLRNPTSEKGILVHIEPKQKLFSFTSSTSNLWTITPNEKVIAVEGYVLTTSTPTLGQYSYDILTNRLTVFSTTAPIVVVTYRLTYAMNAGIYTSWDLTDNGTEVPYEPVVMSIPKFDTKLSLKPNALISNGTVALVDNNNELKDFLNSNTVFMKYCALKVYSWNRNLNPSNSRLIYDGLITGFSSSLQSVNINVQDRLFDLKKNISTKLNSELNNGDEFTEEDGALPARIVYGRVEQMQVLSKDKYIEVYSLDSGTVSGKAKDTKITGDGAGFASALSPEDLLILGGVNYTIDRIVNDNELYITEELQNTVNGATALYTLNKPYSLRNRKFQICGHKVGQLSTTIAHFHDAFNIGLTNSEGFNTGDSVSITIGDKTSKFTVRERCGHNLILLEGIFNFRQILPGVTPVIRNAIDNPRHGDIQLLDKDIEILDNLSTGSSMTISGEAEFNVAPVRGIAGRMSLVGTEQGETGYAVKGNPYKFVISGSSTASDYPNTYFYVTDVSKENVYFWFNNEAKDYQPNMVLPSGETGTEIIVGNTESAESVFERTMELLDEDASNYLEISRTDFSRKYVSSIGRAVTDFTRTTAGISVGTFSNGSAVVNDTDLSSLFGPRDFVASLENPATYYDVLDVRSSYIQFRSPVAAETLGLFQYKKPVFITNESAVYIDVYGKVGDDDLVIAEASDVLVDLLNDAGFTSRLDLPSFTKAKLFRNRKVGLALPSTYSGSFVVLQDAIKDLNTLMVGSLKITKDFKIGYINYSDTEGGFTNIYLDDVMAKTVGVSTSEGATFNVSPNKMSVKYNLQERNDDNDLYVVDNYLTNDLTDVTEIVKEISLPTGYERDAKLTTHDYIALNSEFNTKFSFTAPLFLANLEVGDKVILNMPSLPNIIKGDVKVAGMVTKFVNDGQKIQLVVETFGNVFTRGGFIQTDGADFINVQVSGIIGNGYFCQSNESIDGKEENYRLSTIV